MPTTVSQTLQILFLSAVFIGAVLVLVRLALHAVEDYRTMRGVSSRARTAGLYAAIDELYEQGDRVRYECAGPVTCARCEAQIAGYNAAAAAVEALLEEGYDAIVDDDDDTLVTDETVEEANQWELWESTEWCGGEALRPSDEATEDDPHIYRIVDEDGTREVSREEFLSTIARASKLAPTPVCA